MNESNQPIPAVGVLIVENKKVLLVKHKEGAQHITGVYGLPAGRLEPNETHRHAAVRELFEETGLNTSEDDLYEYPSNHYANVKIKRKGGKTAVFDYYVFVCRKYSGILRESDETKPEWIEVEKLDQLELLPHIKEMVEREVKW